MKTFFINLVINNENKTVDLIIAIRKLKNFPILFNEFRINTPVSLISYFSLFFYQ